MQLLALADELSVEPLRAACEEQLLAIVTKSNAAELEEAAARYRCEQLLTAARTLIRAETSVIGELYHERERLRSARRIAAAAAKLAQDDVARKDSRLSDVQDKLAHERELLLRANTASASESDDYPHAAGSVHYVMPNANNEYWWKWGNGVRPPPEAAISRHMASSAKKKKKKQKASRSDADAASASPAPPAQMHRSLMEAYRAAGPGSVIKLRAGRHLISQHNAEDELVWDKLVYNKSMQIIADDGLSREQVLVGVDDHDDTEYHFWDGILQLKKADVRVAGVTLLVTCDFGECAGFLRVGSGARLWLEDCDLKLAHDAKLDPWFTHDEYGQPHMERGVTVEEGASAVIRDCNFLDADGPAIQIDPRACRVLVERCFVSGCGRGDTRKGRVRPGECGAVELQEPFPDADTDAEDPRDEFSLQDLPPVTAAIAVRECRLEGNLGPAVSYRPAGDIVASFDPPRPGVVARAKDICSAFSLERCTVLGNQLHKPESARVAFLDSSGCYKKMTTGEAQAATGCVWNRAPGAEFRGEFDEDHFSDAWFKMKSERAEERRKRKRGTGCDSDSEEDYSHCLDCDLSEEDEGEEDEEDEEDEEGEEGEEDEEGEEGEESQGDTSTQCP